MVGNGHYVKEMEGWFNPLHSHGWKNWVPIPKSSFVDISFIQLKKLWKKKGTKIYKKKTIRFHLFTFFVCPFSFTLKSWNPKTSDGSQLMRFALDQRLETEREKTDGHIKYDLNCRHEASSVLSIFGKSPIFVESKCSKGSRWSPIGKNVVILGGRCCHSTRCIPCLQWED